MKSLPFLMLTFLVLSSFTHTCSGANYVINVILPLTGTSNSNKFEQWASAAQLAAEHATQSWTTDTLTVDLYDHRALPDEVTRLSLQSVANTSVVAVIGYGDEQSSGTAGKIFEFYQMPFISPSSTFASPLLSMSTADAYNAEVVGSLLSAYSWNKVAILHSTDEENLPLKRAILNIPGLQAELIPLPAGAVDFSTQFQITIRRSINILIIVSRDPNLVSSVLQQAVFYGLYTPGKAILVVGPTTNSSLIESAPLGTIFMDKIDAIPTNLEAFIDMIRAETGPGFGPEAQLYHRTIQTYDGVRAIAKAIEAAPKPITRPGLLSSLKNVDFESYSGRVRFNSLGFRPSMPVAFINTQHNQTFEYVSTYNDSALTQESDPIFPGGSTTVPDAMTDYIPIVVVLPMPGPPGFSLPDVNGFLAYIIELINNDTDLLPPGKKLAALAVDDANSASAVIQIGVALPSYGVAGVVGGFTSTTSGTLQNVLSVFKIPQISPTATAPSLSNKALYPTFMRIVPSDTIQAEAVIALCLEKGWTEVAIVFTDDSYGNGITQVVLQLAEEADIEILLQLNIAASAPNYDDDVQRLQRANPKIVLALIGFDAAPVFAASVSRSGYKPAAWIASDAVLTTTNLQRAINFGAASNVFDGWIGFSPSAGNGPLYEEFMATVQALPEGAYPGLRETLNRRSGFPLRAADILNVYADAIRRVVEAGGDPRNGTTLLHELYKTDLVLLTGRATFDQNGDRVGPYDILNVVNNGNLVVSGRWSAATGVKVSSPLVFPDGTTNIPLSSEPRKLKYLHWTGPAAIIFSVLAILGILASLLMIVVVIHQRNARSIASATWQFLILMLVGTAIGYGSVFTWIGQPQSYICALRIWLPPMAFSLIMAPLLAKTWRLHRIFTLGSLKITPIPLWKLVVIAGMFVFVQLVICIFWISWGTIQPTVLNDKNNRTIAYAICAQSKANQIASYVTYGYLGFIMLIGAYFAFRVRNLPKDFNESRWIGFSIYNTLLFSLIIIILGYALNSFPTTVLILICVCTLAITTGAISFMLVPKMWTLLMHPEKRSGGSSGSIGSRSMKYNSANNQPQPRATRHARHDYSLQSRLQSTNQQSMTTFSNSSR